MKRTTSETQPSARKSVRLKRQRNGSLRAHWYGQYREDGKQTEINLNVPWRGTPPASGMWSDAGDTRFETSRKKAEAALASHVEEARHKGRAEHLTERLIESKTGRRVDYTRLAALPDRWRDLGRESPVTERYLKSCDARFRRFVDFMQSRNPSAAYLYEVTPEDAAAFVTDLRKRLARSSAGATIRLLSKAFARFLPVGAGNPFAAFVGSRGNGKSETIHRKPFTPTELQALLDAASDDDFMLPLITAAACTGMRRGDVCNLKWRDVDFEAGMLAVKTSKTEAAVEIPIFRPLLAVLEECKGNGKKYVFPAAAHMLKDNPMGLTWRFKKIVARAFNTDTPEDLPEPVRASEIEPEALAVIADRTHDETSRDRLAEIFRRYAAGESMQEIGDAVGLKKQSVSYHLHRIEDMVGKPFLRVQAPGYRKAVRQHTQAERKNGQRAASVRDWH
ncbi:MAG: tyrosine-type recombinase/integrase, partial [Verrucomicrobia bacterium]|nr:tyrosine-type recombinase/integrase [Verrucomicrobiota bacterium]